MYSNFRWYLLFLLPLLGVIHEASATAQQASQFQSLAAHYQHTHHARGERKASSDWYLVRQDNQVATAKGDYAEVWQRDDRGELSLTRIYHQDRKVIQYTTGELRTQGRLKNWEVLNQVLDPGTKEALKKSGHTTFMGRKAARYQGKIGGETVKVIWLEKEAIVARLERSGKGYTDTLELKALREKPLATWPSVDLEKVSDYAYLDGADLGDMEYDPFVQRVLGSDGHHHAAGHDH